MDEVIDDLKVAAEKITKAMGGIELTILNDFAKMVFQELLWTANRTIGHVKDNLEKFKAGQYNLGSQRGQGQKQDAKHQE